VRPCIKDEREGRILVNQKFKDEIVDGIPGVRSKQSVLERLNSHESYACGMDENTLSPPIECEIALQKGD